MSEFAIVAGVGNAKNLIYATWLRSYEANSLRSKHIPRDVFFEEHHKVLDGIFDRNPEVHLAVLPDDPDVVLGWSVTEPGLIHFVYVKPSFRKYGIATALLQHVQRPFIYSHATYVLRDMPKHVEGCTFNPYKV